MYKILVSDPLSQQGLDPLQSASNIEVIYETNLTPEELLYMIQDVDALLVRSQTKVTREVLEHAKKLRVVGRAGVGVDNIDIEAATEKGIIVLNAPDGNTISTAEHTFAMMISLARNIPQAYRSTVQGEWRRKDFTGVELNGKTLGILGLGRIGAELSQKAKAFYMNVVAFDPYLTEERAEKLGVTKATLEEVITCADFLSVHTPLTKETRHLINRDVFSQMKDGVRILNCARGGIIEEEALYEAIQVGKVAGAALDVFEVEPPTPKHPLFELPQVIVTPHLGASTVEAQENVAIDVIGEVLNVLEDKPFRNAVNLPSIPKDQKEKLAPYQELAEKLGSFVAQASIGAIKKIRITYAGELAEMSTSPLTRTILKGALSHHLADVNFVNAPHLAKQRGIQLIEEKKNVSQGFTQLIHVEIATENGKNDAAATLLNGFGPRIVKMNGYAIDVVPAGHLLYIRHHDQPGMIGEVGTVLGEHDINIATMQVGRMASGGDAIMVLHLDNVIPTFVRESIAGMQKISSVTSIEL
ncbi:phosphoglycerate dehydrogenase [Risungbinella massiliensis]|uniref:phosphoglycerate dehydrogenase n=1 Tax=Risungbinella massiliensis TaxID=1329796 RepID=UPI0005CC0625|nr:phosphoglycerate dehydrogenase [Risungbinella massiliensis]